MIKDWITSQKTIAKSKKNYAHFDYRTDIVNLRNYVTDPEKVAHHGFYPFIHYKKKSLKFSKSKGRELKERDIRYAAHVDRCIYQYYCHSMNQLYIKRIRELRIQDVPVAYRSDLGLNNIHLAKQAFDFINKNLAILVCTLWFLSFLSTLLHEAGHALGYMIATGDRHWHIRVGSGKKLLTTKRLTVKLLSFDGCFIPSEKNKIDTTAKLIATLLGGPAVSLILVAVLLLIKFGGISLHSEVLASGAIDFFINSALSINLFILILALIPTHYFHGEMKGMETDGLQIINAIRSQS